MLVVFPIPNCPTLFCPHTQASLLSFNAITLFVPVAIFITSFNTPFLALLITGFGVYLPAEDPDPVFVAFCPNVP